MLNVTFYDFNKRKNSLKRPDDETTEHRSFRCVLKSQSSVINPTIEIQSPEFDPSDFNYFYIDKYVRYYWITNTTYIGGCWLITGQSDPLASFANAIKQQSAYVTRSAAESDGDIIDTLYPTFSDCVVSSVPISSPFYGIAPSGGTYIIGVINGEGGKRGALTYYAVNQSGFEAALAAIFSDNTFPDTFDELTREVVKYVSSPSQYIRSCVWVPYQFSGGSATIKLGYFDSGVSATTLGNTIGLSEGTTISIPAHPQAASRGSFLNRAPYTMVDIYLPPFGVIAIDTAAASAGENTLSLHYYLDPCTGVGYLRGGISGLSAPSFERQAVVGVPMEIAGVSAGIGGALGASVMGLGEMVGSIAGAVNSDWGNKISEGANKIASGVKNAMSTVETTGGTNGSFLAALVPPVCRVRHYLLVDEDNANFGRPLYQSRIIGSMSGFIKCGEYHCDFTGAYSSERETIENYLTDDGVFVE